MHIRWDQVCNRFNTSSWFSWRSRSKWKLYFSIYTYSNVLKNESYHYALKISTYHTSVGQRRSLLMQSFSSEKIDIHVHFLCLESSYDQRKSKNAKQIGIRNFKTLSEWFLHICKIYRYSKLSHTILRPVFSVLCFYLLNFTTDFVSILNFSHKLSFSIYYVEGMLFS